MADKDNAEAIRVMREQARYYQIKIDPTWSAEDLAQKIIDVQMEIEAKEDEEFQKAKKLRVKMIRDGWPLANMRIPAGKTCDIPVPLAKRWIEAGVCERADPLPIE